MLTPLLPEPHNISQVISFIFHPMLSMYVTTSRNAFRSLQSEFHFKRKQFPKVMTRARARFWRRFDDPNLTEQRCKKLSLLERKLSR